MSLSLSTDLPATTRPGLLARFGKLLVRLADHMYRHGGHLHGCCMAMAMAVIAAPAPTPAWAADPPPLRIGVLTDMNGPYGDAAGQGSVTAAKLAVADFGATVLGRKIEIIAADHQNKPDIGVAIARTWFDTEGVDMITDLTNSAVAIAVQALAAEKKKVDIVTSTATTAITNETCSPIPAVA